MKRMVSWNNRTWWRQNLSKALTITVLNNRGGRPFTGLHHENLDDNGNGWLAVINVRSEDVDTMLDTYRSVGLNPVVVYDRLGELHPYRFILIASGRTIEELAYNLYRAYPYSLTQALGFNPWVG